MDAEVIFDLRRKTIQNMKQHPINGGPGNEKAYDIIRAKDLLADSAVEITTHEYRETSTVPHGHDFFEINYVLSGRVHEWIGDKHLVLERGNIIIMNPNSYHMVNTESHNDILINILVREDVFNGIFWLYAYTNELFGEFFLNYLLPNANHTTDHLLFSIGHNAFVDSLAERLIKEKLTKHPYREENARHYLALMLSELFYASMQTDRKKQSRITSIINYMNDHLDEVSLQSTADYFHMHPNYLSAYVRKKTGQSFSEILLTIKLNQAKHLLLNTNLNLEDISTILGYSEPLSFYNMFKKHTGISPIQYRKSE